ncbi:glutamate--tRNA ligase [Hymenobacter taeanensis]|uniref:Glutamate--tRNA ligase n=1 Tax=Hymenobacter taeanensis TaxID=2735321 RepID=A0A6M6BGM1_9BACT|nr:MULTISPECIES: glutamate--tRNA ligase family protein [Hymenobacter]QJX47356.1 glutamate--tRNA ligase [Hymenobacter taeanensis]UOQ79305.1 glutamate--tRNA ligase family protein [Hymenobacter sp. 5414T-23]
MEFPVAPVVSRLAPTPSGFLHLGNAVNFTLTWLLVRRAGGQLHLRIDDLDRTRFRPAYLENIFRTLEWLGLDYDLGPAGPDEFERHYSQRHFLGQYEAALQTALAAHPGLFYPCRCSRTELARQALPDGRYPGTCRPLLLPATTPDTAWRAHVPEATPITFSDLWQGPVAVPLGQVLGDFVVRKKDGAAAYQVASVLDDVRLGVTCIVRGLDLLPSTAAQLWLSQYLPQAQQFCQVQFLHHGLLLNAQGQKLSKSTQAGQQRGIVEEASGPQVVYGAVARLLGLAAEAAESLEKLQTAFKQV